METLTNENPKDNMDVQLPLLLCGPVLKRVDTSTCTTIVALSKASTVHLRVFTANTDHCIAESSASSIHEIQLGKNLWVYLLQCESIFASDTFFEYDIEIDGISILDLDPTSIALSGFSRPSFFLPESSRSLILGSCRKPHGASSENFALTSDGLASAAENLEEQALSLQERPSALLMLGDQIYADDVAGPLIEAITLTAKALMGEDEIIPNLGSVSDFPYGTRWEAAYRIGLTSGAAQHHLLALGEYCAMYILAYGGYSGTLPLRPKAPLLPADELVYANDLGKVERFLESAKNVRKLLANVPSYAIFDDHEVTDDWNLDRGVHDSARKDEGARRVISNALCAYWVFQGWGNDPSSFDPSFRSRVAAGCLPHARNTPAGELLDECLLSFDSWQFVAPTNPPIFFLDTRTQRRYVGVLGLGQLAGPKMLMWLRNEIKQRSAGRREEPVYIAAATPVLGFMPIEFLQGAGRRLLKIAIDVVDVDYESWIAQREGYFELMRSLLDCGVRKCVFFSGDVHYGFLKRGRFSHRQNECEMLQIVSSALNNEPSTAGLSYLTRFGARVERRVGFLGNKLKSKLRRFFRPFFYDFATYWGFYTPDTTNGEAWYDESRIVPVGQRKYIVPECHYALVKLRDSKPIRVEFRFSRSEPIGADISDDI